MKQKAENEIIQDKAEKEIKQMAEKGKKQKEKRR